MQFTPLELDPTQTRVRLPDPDTPVRRIFPLHRLLEVVRTGNMALVSPSQWDDPREDLAARCMLDGNTVAARLGQQQPLSAYLAPAWGQCWSLNSGSDTLLRAYSRVHKNELGRNTAREAEGATVITTVQQLLLAGESWHEAGADCHVLVGRVEYRDDLEIAQRIANACSQYGPQFFRTLEGRADPLLQKRSYFNHEEEVRLLMISRSLQHTETLRHFKIDPNQLFESVSFDPRLSGSERQEREAELKEAGYKGPITRDESYQGALFQILMDRDWVDP